MLNRTGVAHVAEGASSSAGSVPAARSTVSGETKQVEATEKAKEVNVTGEIEDCRVGAWGFIGKSEAANSTREVRCRAEGATDATVKTGEAEFAGNETGEAGSEAGMAVIEGVFCQACEANLAIRTKVCGGVVLETRCVRAEGEPFATRRTEQRSKPVGVTRASVGKRGVLLLGE